MAILMTGTAFFLFILRYSIFKNNSARDKRNLLIVAGVIFTVILGCRNGQINYGTDLNNYYRAFQRAIVATSWQALSLTSPFEVGYLVLNYAISRLIKWPQFILFFQAGFCCGFTLRYIYKHCKDVYFSLLVFMSMGILQFYLTGFRQAFAITVSLIALEFAENKKYFWTILFTLMAISFHQTAILFIPVIFLIRMRVTRSVFLIDIMVSILLYKLGPWLVETGNSLFEKNYAYQTYGNTWGGIINVII